MLKFNPQIRKKRVNPILVWFYGLPSTQLYAFHKDRRKNPRKHPELKGRHYLRGPVLTFGLDYCIKFPKTLLIRRNCSKKDYGNSNSDLLPSSAKIQWLASNVLAGISWLTIVNIWDENKIRGQIAPRTVMPLLSTSVELFQVINLQTSVI